jgi:hypothetical protein
VLGRMSEPGCQLWRSTLGGGFLVALAAQTFVKVASKLAKAQKVQNETEIGSARRLNAGLRRSHEPPRVPAMACHLRTCLLSSMDRSNGCKSRVEARKSPESARVTKTKRGHFWVIFDLV